VTAALTTRVPEHRVERHPSGAKLGNYPILTRSTEASTGYDSLERLERAAGTRSLDADSFEALIWF
jgi:hypothetical protein